MVVVEVALTAGPGVPEQGVNPGPGEGSEATSVGRRCFAGSIGAAGGGRTPDLDARGANTGAASASACGMGKERCEFRGVLE